MESNGKSAATLNGFCDPVYKHFYETAPIGFYRTCVKTGKFLMVNPACLEILNCSSLDELQKKYVSTDFYSKTVRNKLIQEVQKNGQVTDFEIKLRLPNGKEKWVMVSARLCENEPCLEGSLTDVTAHKALENKIVELQRKEVGEIHTLNQDIQARINNYAKAESA